MLQIVRCTKLQRGILTTHHGREANQQSQLAVPLLVDAGCHQFLQVVGQLSALIYSNVTVKIEIAKIYTPYYFTLSKSSSENVNIDLCIWVQLLH